MSKSNIAVKWLLSAIHNTSIDSTKQALINGANPNSLDPEQGITAIHAAIIKGNLETVNILIHGPPNQYVQLADLNVVTHQLEPCIIVASKQDNNNKIAIMQQIISYRKAYQRSLLDEYIWTCVNTIQDFTNLSIKDFGLLAHYASRLCGINIGKLINVENNDDRYLIHLCQYSGAKVYNENSRDKIELESWTAYQFLPIRIFSLFEILVKLEAGTISVDERASSCDILRQEILIEIETFKIEQERRAIKDLQHADDIKTMLYATLAEKLTRNILNNPNQQFCLASGYKGHTIYLSFTFKNDSDTLVIRFDNLGVGIDNRHLIKDDRIYPRIIKLQQATSKIIPVKEYITRLFLIKAEALPNRRPNNSTPEEKNLANKHYKQERNKKLAEIYDDRNQLGFVEVLSQQLSLPEQIADTCVTTSHQVGLLHRLEKKAFYRWLLSEEKRCVVQTNRNEGASMLMDFTFWEMIPDIFIVPQYFDCCPDEVISTFINDLQNIEKFYNVKDCTSNSDTYQTLKRILIKDDHIELKSHYQSLNSSEQETSPILIALLQLRLGLKEEGLVDKFKYLNESGKIINLALKSSRYNYTVTEVYLHYFLGLIFYSLNQLDVAEKSFSGCLNLAEICSYDYGYEAKVNQLQRNSRIGLGFLCLEKENYDQASRHFHHIYETAEAAFGLGIINYLEAKLKNGDSKIHGYKCAIYCFKRVDSKISKIFSKARKYHELISTELLKIQQSQPIAPPDLKRNISSPEMEHDIKRRRENQE